MARSFIFARHGETDWNKQKRFIGSEDIPLNKTGQAQALRLSQEMAELSVANIVTSPLKRAWQTAESISDTCGCTLATDKRLSEVDLGDLQGRSEPELDFFKLWVEGRLPYNVESFADVRERVKAAILDAVEQSDGIPAIIAHSGVFFALCHWLNRPHLFREIPHAKAVTITL